MNDLGFGSVTDLIVCYKRDSGTERTVGALRKAYYRDDEDLKGKILAFALKKNEKQISRELDEASGAHANAADKGIFGKFIEYLKN